MTQSPSSGEKLSFADTVKAHLLIIGGCLAIFWGLELIDQLILSQRLDMYGIRPRTWDGLWGIFCAPFLHGGYQHVSANSVPFAIMGWLVLVRGVGRFFLASLIIIVIGGLGTWLIGKGNSVHIGASGLVFGFFGFLLAAGIFERSLKAILSALIVGVIYGSIIWGVLPTKQGISWEGHLFGLLGGVLAAKWMIGGKKSDEAPEARQLRA